MPKQPKKIYTITCVSGGEGKDPIRSRRWGFFFDRKPAEQVILENQTDISELNYYHYAVLSVVGEGPMAIPDELQWYVFLWNHNTPPRAHDGVSVPQLVEVVPIDKPEQYAGILFGN